MDVSVTPSTKKNERKGSVDSVNALLIPIKTNGESEDNSSVNASTRRSSYSGANQSTANVNLNKMRIHTPKSERGLHSSQGNYTKVDLLLPDVGAKRSTDEDQMATRFSTAQNTSRTQRQTLSRGGNALETPAKPALNDSLSRFTRTQNQKLQACWEYLSDEEEDVELKPNQSLPASRTEEKKDKDPYTEYSTLYDEIHTLVGKN
jgi:hypothetical protein